MKKRINIITLLCFFLLNACQHNDKDDDFFNGSIKTVEFTKEVELKGTPIELNDAYRGTILAYDSLIVTGSGEHGHIFNIFSLNSGDKIGKICPTGQGPDDFLHGRVSGQQFQKQGDDLCLWIGDDVDKFALVNLNASIRDLSTVISKKITNMAWAKKWSNPLGISLILDNDYILARSQTEQLYRKIEDGYLPIAYHLYKGNIEVCEKDYVIYKKALIPQGAHDYYWVTTCLGSYDAIHPDHKKIAMGMTYVGQLNILDVETGDLKGYRLKESSDFKYLTNHPQESCTVYYPRISVDEKYIYALYNGRKIQELIDTGHQDESAIIHVYDWEGNPVVCLHTDKRFANMSLDPVQKYLYAIDPNQDITRYDMSFLYK
ncbi:BF3164 family lipoprotein [Phocaeicola sp.]